MTANSNAALVRAMYESFARGDIATVLALFDDDAELEVHGSPTIPFAGRRKGRQEIAAFFEVVGQHTERPGADHIPEVHEIIAEDHKVVAIGVDRVRSRATSQSYESWWVHVIELRDGRIARFREYIDTAAAEATFRTAGA